MKKLLIITFLCSFFALAEQNVPPALIPLPRSVEWKNTVFTLTAATTVSDRGTGLAPYLKEQIARFTGIQLSGQKKKGSTSIELMVTASKDPVDRESYTLSIAAKKITISGATSEGVFRGVQTLLQMIPAEVKQQMNTSSVTFPGVNINDAPAFGWRGLNMDCSRHFMPKEFVKRYIDLLAYYKLNTFHWHLTDDQGWRIEIKRYPRLTSVGAWRKEADGSTYGGFYTQDDIREVVAYAQSRFITVVPEIEMPGHSTAMLAAYPQYSCTGGPFDVTNIWGVHKDIVCAGNDSSYQFLQNILDEVMTLFPGRAIHIGGDEAPKDRWKSCTRCQARIRAAGLKDEHELQNYFISRIAAYLRSNGKDVIGWDEILQGGLAPGAIVQSWQSMQGAVEAAALGHSTITSPASHTYFNSDPEDLDLRVAYSFQPVPAGIPEAQRHFVLGSEANIWSEHAPADAVDDRLFPRLLAFADVLWRDPRNAGFEEFYGRVQKNYADMTALGIRYGRETKALTTSTSYDASAKQFSVTALPGQQGTQIRYTVDGTVPDMTSPLYNKAVSIGTSGTVKIAAFLNGQSIGKPSSFSFAFHNALNARLDLRSRFEERYRAGGDRALIDGVRGSDNFRDGCWQGFEGKDIDCIIDLGAERSVTSVSPRFILAADSWIFLPEQVQVFLGSDSSAFRPPVVVVNDQSQKSSVVTMKDFPVRFNAERARYIRVTAKGIGACPSWHPGAGAPAWMFIDEIVVE